jgi:hypothetical protein
VGVCGIPFIVAAREGSCRQCRVRALLKRSDVMTVGVCEMLEVKGT